MAERNNTPTPAGVTVPAPTAEDLARDGAADLAVAEAATAAPWKVANADCVRMHRQVVGAEHCPDGVSIIERPPQSRAEAMECFFHALLVGWLSAEDAAFIALAREALPAWVRRACAAEAENARLRAEMDGEKRLSSGDGTDRLLAVLYGPPTPGKPTIGKALGGPNAPMLWAAAEEIERLRARNAALQRVADAALRDSDSMTTTVMDALEKLDEVDLL